MGEQDSTEATVLQRPVGDDEEAWGIYWTRLGQLWRTEPEIDKKRQEYLTQRLSTTAKIKQGVYPFKGIKLSRADIEWLLATHENGRGPTDWSDESQRERKGLDLRGADLRQVDLHSLPLAYMRGSLSDGEWREASLEQRNMARIHLEEANLQETHLEEACLRKAHLEETNLREAHLEGADLYRAHLEGAYLRNANLGGAFLGRAFCDASTSFDDVALKHERLGYVSLADVHWGGVHLSNVNWANMKMLGDEQRIRQSKGRHKDKVWLNGCQRAVRANRQLAVVLQEQGLNEVANRFAYRAQVLQRMVLWRQRKFGQYFFSLFLDLLAGYGYKPIRSFISYVIVIGVFMLMYHALGATNTSHLKWNEALVISMTAFHGRGFFPDQFKPGDPQAMIAAIEALVGLIIEVTFIATLTKRLFGN